VSVRSGASAVGVATGLRASQPNNRGTYPETGNRVSPVKHLTPGLTPTEPPTCGLLRALF